MKQNVFNKKFYRNSDQNLLKPLNFNLTLKPLDCAHSKKLLN